MAGRERELHATSTMERLGSVGAPSRRRGAPVQLGWAALGAARFLTVRASPRVLQLRSSEGADRVHTAWRFPAEPLAVAAASAGDALWVLTSAGELFRCELGARGDGDGEGGGGGGDGGVDLFDDGAFDEGARPAAAAPRRRRSSSLGASSSSSRRPSKLARRAGGPSSSAASSSAASSAAAQGASRAAALRPEGSWLKASCPGATTLQSTPDGSVLLGMSDGSVQRCDARGTLAAVTQEGRGEDAGRALSCIVAVCSAPSVGAEPSPWAALALVLEPTLFTALFGAESGLAGRAILLTGDASGRLRWCHALAAESSGAARSGAPPRLEELGCLHEPAMAIVAAGEAAAGASSLCALGAGGRLWVAVAGLPPAPPLVITTRQIAAPVTSGASCGGYVLAVSDGQLCRLGTLDSDVEPVPLPRRIVAVCGDSAACVTLLTCAGSLLRMPLSRLDGSAPAPARTPAAVDVQATVLAMGAVSETTRQVALASSLLDARLAEANAALHAAIAFGQATPYWGLRCVASNAATTVQIMARNTYLHPLGERWCFTATLRTSEGGGGAARAWHCVFPATGGVPQNGQCLMELQLPAEAIKALAVAPLALSLSLSLLPSPPMPGALEAGAGTSIAPSIPLGNPQLLDIMHLTQPLELPTGVSPSTALAYVRDRAEGRQRRLVEVLSVRTGANDAVAGGANAAGDLAAAGGSGGAGGGAGVASVWEAELSILARQAEGDPCDLLREMLRGSVADSALKSKLPRGRGEAGAISGLFPVLGHTLTIRASALEPFDGTKLQLSSSCPQALALALNSVLRRVLVQGEASKGGREAAGACMVEQLSAAVRGLELAALEASDNAFSARRLRERQLQGGVVASRAARAALALAEEAEALLKRARAVVTSMPM